jgi:hypothetical protein
MYKCEKCGNDFETDWRKDKQTIRKESPRFCCREHANSRDRPIELRKKVSDLLRKREQRKCSGCATDIWYENKSGLCNKCKSLKTKILIKCKNCDDEITKSNNTGLCRTCKSSSVAEERQLNFQPQIKSKEYQRRAVKEHRLKSKIALLEYKGNKCECCGYNKVNSALEFHHLDSKTKLFNISSSQVKKRSQEELFREIDKCILLCANCHRELHFSITRLKTSKRIENKLFFINHLGGQCCKCGYDKCANALDFHHIVPSKKEFAIGSHLKRSRNNLLSEVNKCALLCANCHREFHAGLFILENYLKLVDTIS